MSLVRDLSGLAVSGLLDANGLDGLRTFESGLLTKPCVILRRRTGIDSSAQTRIGCFSDVLPRQCFAETPLWLSIYLKGLILAQNERWRRGLGMQVEREVCE